MCFKLGQSENLPLSALSPRLILLSLLPLLSVSPRSLEPRSFAIDFRFILGGSLARFAGVKTSKGRGRVAGTDARVGFRS